MIKIDISELGHLSDMADAFKASDEDRMANNDEVNALAMVSITTYMADLKICCPQHGIEALEVMIDQAHDIIKSIKDMERSSNGQLH